MSQLTDANHNNLVVIKPSADNFGLVANTANQAFQGTRLKFKKGVFTLDKDVGELPLGTRLEAHDTMQAWLHFDKSELVKQIPQEPGKPFPTREELGDSNQALWSLGLDGKPTDPWSLHAYLYLIECDGTRDFTFMTSSWGGRKAVYELARQVMLKRRSFPSAVPVVQLGTTSWTSKRFGRIASPAFTVVDWVGVPGAPNLLVELDDELPF